MKDFLFKRYLFFLLTALLLFIIHAQVRSQQIVTPEAFGGKGDAVILKDGTIQARSNILISKNANFKSTDISKVVYINGAGKAGATLSSVIQSIVNKSTVQIRDSAMVTIKDTLVTYGTDCTNAFIAVNKKARTFTNQTVILQFKNGIYLTKFNNWLAGIKNVKVEGNGASIICTHGAYDSNGSTSANQAFCMPGIFDNVDNNYAILGTPPSFGYTFKTARPGDDFIVLTTPDSASRFKPGDWVMLGGFEGENFGGYPPLYRYFEYIKVKVINNNAGIIHFNSKIINYYDGQWPDSTWKGGTLGKGTPRILNCNRSTFTMIDNVVMNNINFLPFTGWVGKFATPGRNGRVSFYGFINGRFNNVTMNAAYISTCRKAILTNCTCYEYFEPDKEVDTLTIDNCHINNFVLGPGINNENLINSVFTGKFSASPRHLFVSGNTFMTQDLSSSQTLIGPAGNSGSDDVRFGPNTFYFNEPRKAAISHGGFTQMTVGSVINDSLITITYNDWGSANNGRQVVPGKRGETNTGKSLLVTRVFRYKPGLIGVQGNFSSNPVAGDVFKFNYIQNIFIGGKQTIKGMYAKSADLFFDTLNFGHIKYADKNFK